MTDTRQVKPKVVPVNPVNLCSICDTPYIGHGHNAWPFSAGPVENRCCDECNERQVIPARVRLFCASKID